MLKLIYNFIRERFVQKKNSTKFEGFVQGIKDGFIYIDFSLSTDVVLEMELPVEFCPFLRERRICTIEITNIPDKL